MKAKIEKYLLLLLIFLIPTQLAYHFWPSWAFIFGIRVDFLAPALYLTDILIVYLIATNFRLIKPFIKYLITPLAIAIANIIFSTSTPESLYRWLKIFEMIFFAIYLSKENVLKKNELVGALFYSSILYSLVGLAQFLIGHTIGGIFYFLGERTFNINTPAIALVNLFDRNFLRAYSTFSHPNSFAGYLGIVLILFFTTKYIKRNFLNYFLLIILIVTFFMTFSLGALTAIFLLLLFRNREKLGLFTAVISSLLLSIVSPILSKNGYFFSEKILGRLELAQFSGKIISQNFLIGTGLGTFIINIPYRFLQPVHNIFLLVFAETGIFGLLIFSFLLLTLVKKSPLIFLFIIFTGLFDHYTLTLQQNLLLFSLLSGLALR